MDSGRGKPPHTLRGYKSAFPHNRHHQENNNYNLSSSHGIFKTSRIQRHPLKWRKDHYSRGTYRSRFPYRKCDPGNRKSNKSAEDVEEEERKKKLTDTAKILLNKIKTWNAESNHDEDEPPQSIAEGVSESSCKHEEKVSSEGKPKRIAHSKKVRLVISRTPKSFSQPAKAVARYDVNKDTVKDFQNRIQHKLIEEIMQMPKENLQNVLNDPKINPIMEVKMSRLVRENKLLIAQKLRTLAESKMKSPGCSTNPQLLLDIDKLIDPVIETDLSVLPFELIKQMENVFQVQFDYSPNNETQIESGVCDSAIDNSIPFEEETPVEGDSEQIVKEENSEDLSFYECSTDEDEEVGSFDVISLVQEFSTSGKEVGNKMERVKQVSEISAEEPTEKRKPSTEFKPLEDIESNVYKEEIPSSHYENPCPLSQSDNVQNFTSPTVQLTSISCQTEQNTESSSTQTENIQNEVETLYGVPLPKEATDDSISSLLEEVNSIQNLTNKLNERRFRIFLQLAKLNPSGNFMCDEATKNNFIETVSNGNLYLVESLKQFFTNSRHPKQKFKGCRWKSTGRNSNRSRLSEEKNTQNQ